MCKKRREDLGNTLPYSGRRWQRLMDSLENLKCFSNGSTSLLELDSLPNLTAKLCLQFSYTQAPTNQKTRTVRGEISLRIHWTIVTRRWTDCDCWSYSSVTVEFQPDYFAFIYWYLLGRAHTFVVACMRVEVRGQFAQVSWLLPTRRLQGLSLGCQVWQEVLLPAGKASHNSRSDFEILNWFQGYVRLVVNVY